MTWLSKILAGPNEDVAFQSRLRKHWLKMTHFIHEHEDAIAEAAESMKENPRPNTQSDLKRFWFWSTDGAFLFNCKAFFSDDPDMNFYLLVRPSMGHHGFQPHHPGLNAPAVVLSVMKDFFNPIGLSSRIKHDLFVHEVTHHFDEKRKKGKLNTKTGKKFDSGDEKGYFNDPLERNAYYQEALTTMHSLLEMDQVPKDLKKSMLGDFPTFKGDFFARWLDKDFQTNLEPEHMKKLIKRLYGFWKHQHEKLDEEVDTKKQ